MMTSTTDGKEGLESLGEAPLQAIASFLPKTSVAFLAVALTAPSSSFREKGWDGDCLTLRDSTNAIISSIKGSEPYLSLLPALCKENEDDSKGPRLKLGGGETKYDNEWFRAQLSQQLKEYYEKKWEVLDFADIEKALAVRLTDDDVGAVLVCIDAKNNLKHLKLTNLYGIKGRGLEPLKSSSTLEKADLGLSHQFDGPVFYVKPKLSKNIVLPIIRDILANSQYSFAPELKRVNVPFKWRISSLLLPGEDWERPIFNRNSMCFYFGMEDFEDFIHEMKINGKSDMTDTCFMCGSGYSFHCYSDCCDCGRIVCTGNYECRDEDVHCQGAGHYCSAITCGDCYGKKDNTYVKQCEYCVKNFCEECRMMSVQNDRNSCGGCKSAVLGGEVPEEEARKRQYMEDINKQAAQMISQLIVKFPPPQNHDDDDDDE